MVQLKLNFITFFQTASITHLILNHLSEVSWLELLSTKSKNLEFGSDSVAWHLHHGRRNALGQLLLISGSLMIPFKISTPINV